MTTTPVGFYDGSLRGTYQTHDGSSVYGVHDLMGNLFEWIGEWYDPGYYAIAPRMDPQGPASGELRLLKSEGFDVLSAPPAPPGQRVVSIFWPLASRGGELPEPGWAQGGIRCARDVP